MEEFMEKGEWSPIGGDLEAHFLDSCYRAFYLSYGEFQKKKRKIESSANETDHARILAAHKVAYNHVVDLIKERIIKRNRPST